MADWTIVDVVKVAPEFAAVPTSLIQFYIDMAERRISEDWFGGVYADAGIFLTAHLMTLFQPQGTLPSSSGGGGSGVVSKQRVGEVEVTFDSASIGAYSGSALRSSLFLSTYGMMYAELMRNRGPAVTVL